MSAIQQLLTDHIDIWTAAETEKKSGRGRASGNAASVYGIKKLRELILELAVRGKLVPQDASDEPACELLKRGQVAKEQLVTEGKIRSKQLSEIADQEKLFDIPRNWEWTRIGSIATIKGGKRLPAGAAFSSYPTPFIYVQVTNMKNGTIIDENLKYIDEDAHKIIKQYIISSKDIYITIAGTIGDVGDVPERFDGMNLTENAAKIVFDILNKEWLIKSLRSLTVKKQFTDKAIQMAQPKLALHRIGDSVLAIPPIQEQLRIVAKVNELMALCDLLETQHCNAAGAHEQLVSHLLGTLTQSQSAADFNTNWERIAAHFDTLFTTEASIDALKQTLLQLAIMGKLVAQDASDEPASELLKRIGAEKAKLVAEGKISKEKLLPLVTNEEKFIELPFGWHWARFSDYATDIATGPFGSMIHQADYIQGGVPLINPSHMINDKIVPDKDISVTIEMAKDLHVYKIYEGDIVMARRGEVGRIALVTENENGWLCGTGSFVLRFCDEVSRNYLRLLFRSEFVRSFLAGEAVGTTMVNLNHGILKKMPIGIPPLAEQHRIVRKIDELMYICNQLRSSITGANQQQQKLANVLVEHAVAG